jgi:hypothetical protein
MVEQKPIGAGPGNSLKPETSKDHNKIQTDEWKSLFDFYKTVRFTKYVDRALPPEGRRFYNEHLSEVERLVRYTSLVEMDNTQLSIELIRLIEVNNQLIVQCENLSVYAAMIQYYFNTGKGINFLKKINIQRWLLKNDGFYKKTLKAMNYV